MLVTSAVPTAWPPVLSKSDYYQRWWNCEFGNRIRAWSNVDDALADDSYDGLFTVRYKIASAPFCDFNIHRNDLRRRLDEWIEQGAEETLFTFNESMIDTKLTIQGEIVRSIRGLELFYSRVPVPMRRALLAEPRYATGLTAYAVLQFFMDPNSVEDINLLLDRYPDHSIEFSTYSYFLGWAPHRNTIIWEVRKY